MNVLLIGGGGREHAIAVALSKSPKLTKLYCAPGNGGIAQVATCVPIKATDISEMADFAKREAIDFVVVTPDDPLALGMVDALTEAGISAFGPTKAAAMVESSKAFSKALMAKYNIPTAAYRVFGGDVAEAVAYIHEQGAPIVVKCDGLALGKGVVVAQTVEEAEQAVRAMMEDKQFGDSGSKVVIEACMTGPEVTVLAFTDGKTICPMPAAQDHKRVFDHDQGPNTGGMGAFCPSLNYTPELAKCCMDTIFRPTVDAMGKEGRPFQGVLYFGLMLTPDGPKVIEYNARFGDPETQPLLALLETDLLDIFQAVVEGRLDEMTIQWSEKSACCVVLASGGYPGKYETGKPIFGLDQAPEGAQIHHAGTRWDGDTYQTAGGRVLGVTAVGDTLEQAVEQAYKTVPLIQFEGMHYRRDIGRK
ncbi:MAG: phosphoribosylamine--glycine ligase [Oscillospiraceae bacterium]|nr:phosphoribosylamine--glycine ligase [Oscillospiraceae bacterium]